MMPPIMGLILGLLVLINLNVVAIFAHAETPPIEAPKQELSEEAEKPSNYEMFIKAADFIKSLWLHMQDEAPKEDTDFPAEDPTKSEEIIETRAARAPPVA